jgi:hypothetical protein
MVMTEDGLIMAVSRKSHWSPITTTAVLLARLGIMGQAPLVPR